MPNIPKQQRSPWTGEPTSGRDNRSKMPWGQSPQPPLPQQQARGAALQTALPNAAGLAQQRPIALPPPSFVRPRQTPFPGAVGGGGSGSLQGNFQRPPQEYAQWVAPLGGGQQGDEEPGNVTGDTAGGGFDENGNPIDTWTSTTPQQAPGTPPGTSPPPSGSGNVWEDKASALMDKQTGMSEAQWQAAEAEAVSGIQQDTAQAQWEASEQMGARGMGASTMATTQQGALATQGMLAEARARNDLATKKAMYDLEKTKNDLAAIAQFATIEEKREIDLILADLAQQAQDLAEQSQFTTDYFQAQAGDVPMPPAGGGEAMVQGKDDVAIAKQTFKDQLTAQGQEVPSIYSTYYQNDVLFMNTSSGLWGLSVKDGKWYLIGG